MASADGPARHLCAACEATAPSAALLAFSRLCEAVSQAAGRPLDAEALLPLVSLALAHALVHGRAPHVPAALELASRFVGGDVHTRHGYCLTTVQAAASFVADQAPPAR